MIEPAADQAATAGPEADAWQVDDGEKCGNDQHACQIPRRRHVGANGGDGHGPGLRVDPLEGGRAEKAERFAGDAAAIHTRDGRRSRDPPGEIDQIGRPQVSQPALQAGQGFEQGAESQADRQHHQEETARHAQHVRQRPAESEGRARRQQHGVVRSGRDG